MSVLANPEAEGALIGCLLQDNRLIDRAADKLEATDFSEEGYQHLYGVIVREASLGHPVNPVTLKPYFDDTSHLLALTSQSAALLGFNSFVAQVVELAKRRHMLAALTDAVDMVADMSAPMEAIMDAADAAVSPNETRDGVVQLSAVECLDGLIASYDEPNYGVTSKVMPEFDKVAGKLRPKELIILAARPGMGKTAAALSYSLGAAQNGHGVLFISLEMSGTELAARMASDLCYDGKGGVPYSKIRDGDMDRDQHTKVLGARRMMADMPLRIVDAGKLTTARLAMLVMRTKRRMEAAGQSLDLVVVDYLQLLQPDHQARSMYEKVSEISMALKAIAKTYGVAVMALAQLSREVEKRPDRRPQLSDLRDSGQIEQDADGVIFLLREEYYFRLDEPPLDSFDRPSWEEKLKPVLNKIEFICSKRRNGVTGTATGSFYGQYQAVRGAA